MTNADTLFLPTVGQRKVGRYWFESRDGCEHSLELFSRHYSFYRYRDERVRRLFVGPGEKMVLITESADALFVWRKFISADGQDGVNCAVFRNESDVLSSDLIKDAESVGWRRWPGCRFFTYVNPRLIRSTNPGACFRRAGWRVCGITAKRSLMILEKHP